MNRESARAEICHLFVSPLVNESRLFKELGTVQDIVPAEKLLIIGRQTSDGPATGKLEHRYPFELVKLMSDLLPKTLPFQLIKFIEWTFRAAHRAKRSGAHILHCHSLPAAPAAVLARLFSRDVRIIYDAHELETRRANMSPLRQKASAVLERLLMPYFDEVLVVSPSIKDHYEAVYPGKSITLLMNLPVQQSIGPSQHIREKLGIDSQDKLVIYLGALSPTRGIKLLLEAAPLAPDWHYLFLGFGPLTDLVVEHAKTEPNVHYLPPVAQAEIISCVSEADLSFSVLDCRPDNHRFALPNKFFQSLLAGVPVLVNAENVDMISIGNEAGGVYTVPYDAVKVGEFLTGFAPSKRHVHHDKFVWESQAHLLISAYQRMGLTRIQ